jgi:hypothetical protein
MSSGFLVLIPLLAGCGSMGNTPKQESTLAALSACDHFPGVWIDRVESDGRYWVKQNNEGNWRLFQQCVAKQRLDESKGQYASAEPKDIVYAAYFTKIPPPSGFLSKEKRPERITNFTVDQPVTFFLEIHKTGKVWMGKFKWYMPDGTLAEQQDRVLREGATTAQRTWFTQTLPSAKVQTPGTWSLELIIAEQSVSRYTFDVSQ